MKAMILAAGFGTRLKPLTERIPKALIEYEGEPMIVRQINLIKSLGISSIVINTHHLFEKMKDFFSKNSFGVEINLIVEKEILGTGGGIINAAEFLKNDDALIINTDVVTDFNFSDIIEFHQAEKPLSTLLIQKRNTSRYLEFDDLNLIGRANKNSNPANLFAFNGCHIISKDFFSLKLPAGYSDIIDVYISLVHRNNTIIGCDAKAASFLDIGKPENLSCFPVCRRP